MAQDEFQVAAIVLAAGHSSRMGAINKLLAPLGGTALIRQVLDQVCRSRAGPVIVVTGYEEHRVREALAACDVTFAHNDRFAAGLSTSLRRGLEAVPETAAGALICLGDMPKLTADSIDRLIAAFREHRGEKICIPVFRGRQGNPVLWPRRYFAAMRALRGDAGAKKLIDRYRDAVVDVAMTDDGVLRDVDTPEALKALQ